MPRRDRQRLERLCRYVARPPIAQERLETTADGRCRYNFRHAWKNGVHAVLLEPLDLLARLCALIPPPRFHMLRDHGVLAATPRRGPRSSQAPKFSALSRHSSRCRSRAIRPRSRGSPSNPLDIHGRGCSRGCSRSTP
ncbi:transposase [Enhygromyxa salina]|uniref:transposase n=1 Tax=Enhygromyxa salina TaxID=215803 RepID=UPI00358FB04C